MEASQCLDTKNQTIIRKVQSVTSSSTVKDNSKQSSLSCSGGSAGEKQIEKLSYSSQATWTKIDQIETENSGSFY